MSQCCLSSFTIQYVSFCPDDTGAVFYFLKDLLLTTRDIDVGVVFFSICKSEHKIRESDPRKVMVRVSFFVTTHMLSVLADDNKKGQA